MDSMETMKKKKDIDHEIMMKIEYIYTNQSIRQCWQHEERLGNLSLYDGTHRVSRGRISDGGKGKRPYDHKEQPM